MTILSSITLVDSKNRRVFYTSDKVYSTGYSEYLNANCAVSLIGNLREILLVFLLLFVWIFVTLSLLLS